MVRRGRLRNSKGQFTKAITSTEFFINIDAMVASSEYVGTIAQRSASRIRQMAYDITKATAEYVITSAAIAANEDRGFPYEFQEHLISAAEKLNPTVIVTGGELFVSLDLEEQLGSYAELRKAYHQGAQIEGGGHVDGPYTGQPLKQDDTGIRHIFWEALREGAEYAEIPDPATGKSRKIKIKDGDSKWEETKQKYLEIWGEKAPEWLFIQFGQEEWEPYVPQINILKRIEDGSKLAIREELQALLQEEVAIANSFQPTGLEIGFTKKGQGRVYSGTYYNPETGKTIRRGQFLPKNVK